MVARFRMAIVTVMAVLAVVVGASAASAIETYRVFLNNTDDLMTAIIRNSAHPTGQVVATSTYAADNVTVDITAFVSPGTNVLDFALTNSGGGSTWGDTVYRDLATIHSDFCGKKGEVGCDDNDQTTFENRIVDTFEFQVATDGTAVPEPATLMLVGSGLAALAGVARRRRGR
jgi:hypothetical protein